MSTLTPPPLGDAARTPASGNGKPRTNRRRRIALSALAVALALVAIGAATWQIFVAPQIQCRTTTAADPARTGSVTEYCLPSHLQSSNGGAIAVGPDGNLWVAYYARDTIARVTPQGVFTEFTVSPAPQAPGVPFSPSIVRAPDGVLWYMAAGKLVRMNTSGQVVSVITPPADMAQLGYVTLGPDGAIWLSNYISAHQGSSDRFAKVTTTGQFTERTLTGEYAVSPIAGPDGAFWMPIDANSAIGRLTLQGEFTRFSTNSDWQINGLIVGPDDKIWFIDNGGHVGRMTPQGDVTLFTVASNTQHSTTGPSIGSGPDGNVWFSYESGVIGRITPSGVITKFALPHNSQISAITAGPDGGVWFLQAPADQTSIFQPARLVRVTP